VWTAGPYRRTVDLPESVDASRANASYDNGVLVVIFPLSPRPISGAITLSKVGTAKGQRIRHVGRDLRPR
jgi:HSP20 family protein